jgi:hypothetical protein
MWDTCKGWWEGKINRELKCPLLLVVGVPPATGPQPPVVDGVLVPQQLPARHRLRWTARHRPTTGTTHDPVCTSTHQESPPGVFKKLCYTAEFCP